MEGGEFVVYIVYRSGLAPIVDLKEEELDASASAGGEVSTREFVTGVDAGFLQPDPQEQSDQRPTASPFNTSASAWYGFYR